MTWQPSLWQPDDEPAEEPAGRAPAPGAVRYSPGHLARLLGLPEPTAEQAAVISAPLAPVAVVAGAGSGKSETMAGRLVWLVANEMVRPEQVLGLTFTRKAAAELGQRVRARLAGLRRAGLTPGAQAGPPGQPGRPGQAAGPGQPSRPGQPAAPGQPGRPRQAAAPGQGGRPGPSAEHWQPGQPGWPGQSQPGQFGQPTQPWQDPQPWQHTQSGGPGGFGPPGEFGPPGQAGQPVSQAGALDGEPIVSTYHSYAARLVADHALREALEPSLRLITPAVAWQFAARMVAAHAGPMDAVTWSPPEVTAAVVALAGELAEHLRSPADVEEYGNWLRTAAQTMPGSLTAKHRKILECQRAREQLIPIVAAYGAAKAAREVMDYGDQVALAARIASRHPEVGAAERARYQVVLLDEFQDTSHAQLVLLRALFGGGHPVTAVGDPCQSIYGWRGASAGNLRRFARLFPARGDAPGATRPAAVRVLATSFRNTQRVLEVAGELQRALTEQAPEVPRLVPAPSRAGRGAVVCALLESATQEARWVADQVQRLLRLSPAFGPDGVPWPPPAAARGQRCSIAVLCRKRSQFPALRAAIEARGIPVEVVGLGGLLTVPEVADIVATLRVLHDPGAAGSLARLLTGPRWRIGPRDLVALGRRARKLADGPPVTDVPAPRAGERGTPASGTEGTTGPLRGAPAGAGEPGKGGSRGAGAKGFGAPPGAGGPGAGGPGTGGPGTGGPGTGGPGTGGPGTGGPGTGGSSAGRPGAGGSGAGGSSAGRPGAGGSPADGSRAVGAKGSGAPAGEDPMTEAVTDLTADPGSLVEALDDLGSPGPYSAEGFARFGALAAELRTLRMHVGRPLPDLVGEVERVLGLDVEVAAQLRRDPGVARADLDAFADAAAAFADDEEAPTLGAFLAYLTAAENEEFGLESGQPSGTGAVILTTIHAAKGLEWDAVVVPGMSAGAKSRVFPAKPKVTTRWTENPRLLPFSLRGDTDDLPVLPDLRTESLDAFTSACTARDLSEERRLAYVAVTRAAYWVACSGYWWGEGATPLGPSEFLEEVRAVCESGVGTVAHWAPAPEEDAQNPALAEPETVDWPAEPTGPVHAAVRDAAMLVEQALSGARAGRDDPPLTAPDRAHARAWTRDTDLLLAELAERRGDAATAVALPARLSVSSLVTMAADPGQLAQQIRRPMPRPPSPQARRGTAFHRWLEERFGQQRLIDPADLLGAADDLADDPDAADLAELRELFEASDWGGQWPVEVEVPFETRIAGRIVGGRIDAVFGEPGEGFDVIDWKTGEPPGTDEDFQAAAVQLAAYRVAWARLAGVPLDQVRAAFYYVRHDLTLRPADLLDQAGLAALIEGIPQAG